MKTSKAAGGLVYSTESGRMCPGCRRPIGQCTCRQPRAASASASDGIVRVSRETQGRAGKGVTVIRGLALAPEALAALGKRLKAGCGAGGTVKDGVIEIQGDHRDTLVDALSRQGFTVKRAGG
jgi:translation initiation factor 1